MNYLSPLNREDNGFIDQDTWQQINYGNFFPADERLPLHTTYIPYPLSEESSYNDIKDFNNKLKKNTNSVKEMYSIEELLKADFDNVPLEKLPIDQVDPELRKIAEVKKSLFDKSCTNALLHSLYSWLISATKSDTDPITADTMSALNARYFPPQPVYSTGDKEAIAILEKLLEKRGFRYEVISERQANEGHFRCKIILHFKMKDLILKNERLRQMTQFHD